MNYQYINSKLFGTLVEQGKPSLLSVYVMLLKGRKSYHRYVPQKNSNNKVTKGKRLLSKESGVSLTALNTHLQEIVDMGLGYFQEDGGFFLVGSRKIDQIYGTKKKVPVVIGKNLRETKGNINAVLITAAIYRQAKEIERKITLNKALCKEDRGETLSSTQRKLIANAKKRGISKKNLNKVENFVLSNIGISKTIRGFKNKVYRGIKKGRYTSHGGYWRKVLRERGFLISRRRFIPINDMKYTYQQYLEARNGLRTAHGYITFYRGRIVKPIPSEVFPVLLDFFSIYKTPTLVKTTSVNLVSLHS